tara:strand:- start:519 stop:674 length:156 start_codon:yes stop_codon:yes gene_type:complete
MKSEGLGDVIDSITYFTGIKFLVIKISDWLGISCGCEERRKYLNKIFPFKN